MCVWGGGGGGGLQASPRPLLHLALHPCLKLLLRALGNVLLHEKYKPSDLPLVSVTVVHVQSCSNLSQRNHGGESGLLLC